MAVRFTTNIDCCKGFMSNISGLPLEMIRPVVGEKVLVYHDSEFELWMPVAECRWKLTNGTSPDLICELSCPSHLNIPQLEKLLRGAFGR